MSYLVMMMMTDAMISRGAHSAETQNGSHRILIAESPEEES